MILSFIVLVGAITAFFVSLTVGAVAGLIMGLFLVIFSIAAITDGVKEGDKLLFYIGCCGLAIYLIGVGLSFYGVGWGP